MLKKHSSFFVSLLALADFLIIALSWVGAYYLRFNVDFFVQYFPPIKGVPDRVLYLKLLFFIAPIWGFTFKLTGLYTPRRSSSRIEEAIKIIKGSIISVISLITVIYFLQDYKYSRLVFVIFVILSAFSIAVVRMFVRYALRQLRKRGYNLRYIIIVGAGRLGMEVLDAINAMPEMGYRVIGFLTRDKEKIGKSIKDVKVLDTYENIEKVMEGRSIDQVIIAMPLSSYKAMEFVLKSLMDELVDIKVIPDVYQYITLGGGVEELNGLPIINLRDSPLYGWNMIIKRLIDVSISLIGIVLASPIMLIIAILIKVNSKGAVFYKQERMGLDGKTFNMLKFRSMQADAEAETGAVWATRSDPRRTNIGSFLRKTSLDELPQLFNVLTGEMSLVGPRPERPIFVNEFKKKVPRYMIRHKMKSGMTGWAQINGWRGNTSIEKRIEHDLYYIENWTILFDLKILMLTIFKVWVDKEAY